MFQDGFLFLWRKEDGVESARKNIATEEGEQDPLIREMILNGDMLLGESLPQTDFGNGNQEGISGSGIMFSITRP